MNLATFLIARGFSNTYVASHEGLALIVDPGSFDRQLLLYLEERRLRLAMVLLTHRHASHTDGLRTLRRIYDFEVYARDAGAGELGARALADGAGIAFGSREVVCLETPGHSPDSVSYRLDNWLFTGDTLMAGDIGSSDDGAARRLLVDSIWARLLVWPDDTLVLPGHGPPTRVGVEKRFNPHLACGAGA